MADKKIDPRFYLPVVDGYEYEDKSGEHVEVAKNDDFVLDVPMNSGLQPPEGVAVVEQIFKKGPDGRTVVDLVLEVDDVAGATEYEVRVAAL